MSVIGVTLISVIIGDIGMGVTMIKFLKIFKDTGWFRLFGRGLKWKHENLGLLFSERNGYKKYLKIGKWIIGYLPR